jgi:prolyl-tRNA synthetase
MKRTELFTKTSKTAPADETSRNAALLIRAGYIHKEMAGVYAYEPLGLRVLENIKQIVREEMNAVGGQEIMMTSLQPKELWEKTNRWDDEVVDNWFKTKLANGTELGVGLTHEEPIVAMAGKYINSYKDLPFSVYQIGVKFRNELRAKSGLLRGREFIMKDMYSFARNRDEHLRIYEAIAAAYGKVYDRLGIGDLVFRTKADGGIFTKEFSDEFQAVCPVGEDTIYLDRAKRLAVNKEVLNDENLAVFGLNRETLEEARAIEVGNIFHLESKYPDALGVFYTDEAGKRQSVINGCYGIGVSRLMGAIAEIFADDQGLNWPTSVAPFQAYLVDLGATDKAQALYNKCVQAGIEVLWDDRDARAGDKFADADLLGIPYRLTVSAKTGGQVEFKRRGETQTELLTPDAILAKLGR